MKSIVRTLTFSLGAWAVLVFVLALAATIWLLEYERNPIREDCDGLLAGLSRSVEVDEHEVPVIVASDSIAELKRHNPQLWYMVSVGTRFVEYNAQYRPELPFSLPYSGPFTAAVLDDGRAGKFACLTSLAIPGHPSATLILSGGRLWPSARAQFFFADNWPVLSFIALAFAAVVAFGVLLAARYVKTSLARVTELAKSVDPSAPQGTIPLSDIPLELRELVSALNVAFDEIANFIVQQRRFLGNVAHELRNPLAVLRAKVDTVAETSVRASLVAEIRRLTSLVGAMLDLARLQETHPETTLIDLRELTREVLADYAPSALDQNLQLEFDADGTGPILVEGVEVSIRSAIGNIVANAIVHARGATGILATLSERGNLSISDDGVGVANGLHHRMVEPFEKVGGNGQGSGLGLSIVQEIMRAHGGKLVVEPRLGGGLAVRLTFPIVRP
ncbi:MAG: sensor histidine kinase [Hyphomicrobiales bacterium]|nr:sensor histidine kinase [Hyphomicrobiales bacterium]